MARAISEAVVGAAPAAPGSLPADAAGNTNDGTDLTIRNGLSKGRVGAGPQPGQARE